MTEFDCKRNLEDIGAPGVAFGTFLLVVSSLSIVPSLVKPVRMRSTVGISQMTLLLTNLQQTLTVANVLILKFPQVKICASDPLGCQPSLIVLYQSVVCWLLLYFCYVCVVWYPEPPTEETRRRNRLMWHAQCYCYLPFILCVTLWSAATDCGPVLGWFGHTCGYGASLLMLVRFMPQLYTSCVTRTAGGISYTTYLIIGVGGFLATYYQVCVSKERISTWMPVFIGNCAQTTIIVFCAYHDCCHRRRLPHSASSDRAVAGDTEITGTCLEGDRARPLTAP